MCPFIDEEESGERNESFQQFNFGATSAFFKNDRRYLFIGGTAVAILTITVIFLLKSNFTKVNIEELPVIRAEQTEFKEKPEFNKQVQHQDKIVYDNISGDKRVVVEKLAPKPENVLNIPEVDISESLSDEEKQNIIQAFDDLAPEKRYQIDYVQDHVKKDSSFALRSPDFPSLSRQENKQLQQLKNKKHLSEKEKKLLKNLEKKVVSAYKSEGDLLKEDSLPPINRVSESSNKSFKKTKKRLKDIVLSKSIATKGKLMVQIASVKSQHAAEEEYARIVARNRFLKGKGKRIFRVDLGEKGIRYRIQVGPFNTTEDAKKIISAMKNNGCFAYISK
ncbi:MAG: SPOR domain-containing protein [Alphaproteobacteria bacterium]|nr:SPOR domain-containing protein [Alphaproteobacteria bacterium]